MQPNMRRGVEFRAPKKTGSSRAPLLPTAGGTVRVEEHPFFDRKRHDAGGRAAVVFIAGWILEAIYLRLDNQRAPAYVEYLSYVAFACFVLFVVVLIYYLAIRHRTRCPQCGKRLKSAANLKKTASETLRRYPIAANGRSQNDQTLSAQPEDGATAIPSTPSTSITLRSM